MMLNQVILVGRIDSVFKFKGIEGGLDECVVSLCVGGFGSEDECDDIIDICLGNLSNEVAKHLELGMTLGVKARLVKNSSSLNVVAEKVTFIKSKDNATILDV